MDKIQEIKDGIHALRLDWAENGIPAIVLRPISNQPDRLQIPIVALTLSSLVSRRAETKADELRLAFQSGGAKALAEVLKSRKSRRP
jgi:hypothetical protein